MWLKSYEQRDIYLARELSPENETFMPPASCFPWSEMHQTACCELPGHPSNNHCGCMQEDRVQCHAKATHCIPNMFPVNLPDLIHIWSRLAQKHWPEAGPIILAHRLASGLDPSSIWSKPDPVSQNQIKSKLVLHSMIQAVCGRNQQSFETGSRLMAFCQNQA